jgi:RNA polymerase sigma factor (sigma-70 family)
VLDEAGRVRAAAAGDHAAYEALVDVYQHKVYRLCLRMARDPVAAEDLAQEAFLKAFVALPSFRYDSSFSTWLYKVTVRQCLDWRRRVERESTNRVDADIGQRSGPDTRTPERLLIEKEQTAQLRLLVDELREPYRTVTRLFYLEGRTYQDISDRMGTPLKTIESQLYRARLLMRQKGEVLR